MDVKHPLIVAIPAGPSTGPSGLICFEALAAAGRAPTPPTSKRIAGSAEVNEWRREPQPIVAALAAAHRHIHTLMETKRRTAAFMLNGGWVEHDSAGPELLAG